MTSHSAYSSRSLKYRLVIDRLICDSRMLSKLYSSNGVGAAMVALILAATDISLRLAFAATRFPRLPSIGIAKHVVGVRVAGA